VASLVEYRIHCFL